MLNEEQKKQISAYLIEHSCNPALKGFNILVDLISLSFEEPMLNKAQLFSKYARVCGGNEGAAYRSVKYLLDNSLFPEKRVYSMIKTAVIQVRDNL